MNLEQRRKYQRHVIEFVESGQLRMSEHFIRHLRSIAQWRRVEIVHQLVQLGARRSGGDMMASLQALTFDEQLCLAVCIRGERQFENLEALRERLLGYLLSNPVPTSMQQQKTSSQDRAAA